MTDWTVPPQLFIDRLARFGWLARGAVYLGIGVIAALAALACRAPDAVLVPGAHLCAADDRDGLEPRYDAWRDEIAYEGSLDDESVNLAPPVASSSLDLLFDRGAVGGRNERSLVVDGAVALVGEDLRLVFHSLKRAVYVVEHHIGVRQASHLDVHAWLNPSVFGLLQLEVHVCMLLGAARK